MCVVLTLRIVCRRATTCATTWCRTRSKSSPRARRCRATPSASCGAPSAAAPPRSNTTAVPVISTSRYTSSSLSFGLCNVSESTVTGLEENGMGPHCGVVGFGFASSLVVHCRSCFGLVFFQGGLAAHFGAPAAGASGFVVPWRVRRQPHQRPHQRHRTGGARLGELPSCWFFFLFSTRSTRALRSKRPLGRQADEKKRAKLNWN